tara:strand:+ start:1749 stop:2042 length:294 start_codon:yes stop_codon:yes gene_type:complete
MNLEVTYEGRSWEPRVTMYRVVMGQFHGRVEKHNGQFIKLDLFLRLRSDWQVFYGYIVADNKKELKQIIEKKISEFNHDVTKLNEFLMDFETKKEDE